MKLSRPHVDLKKDAPACAKQQTYTPDRKLVGIMCEDLERRRFLSYTQAHKQYV